MVLSVLAEEPGRGVLAEEKPGWGVLAGMLLSVLAEEPGRGVLAEEKPGWGVLAEEEPGRSVLAEEEPGRGVLAEEDELLPSAAPSRRSTASKRRLVVDSTRCRRFSSMTTVHVASIDSRMRSSSHSRSGPIHHCTILRAICNFLLPPPYASETCDMIPLDLR